MPVIQRGAFVREEEDNQREIYIITSGVDEKAIYTETEIGDVRLLGLGTGEG